MAAIDFSVLIKSYSDRQFEAIKNTFCEYSSNLAEIKNNSALSQITEIISQKNILDSFSREDFSLLLSSYFPDEINNMKYVQYYFKQLYSLLADSKGNLPVAGRAAKYAAYMHQKIAYADDKKGTLKDLPTDKLMETVADYTQVFFALYLPKTRGEEEITTPDFSPINNSLLFKLQRALFEMDKIEAQLKDAQNKKEASKQPKEKQDPALGAIIAAILAGSSLPVIFDVTKRLATGAVKLAQGAGEYVAVARLAKIIRDEKRWFVLMLSYVVFYYIRSNNDNLSGGEEI